ncbi:probable serine incorporator isoform X1 [Hydra vulgaris]|uniref:probable serine incorporator isoform X1 n=1 Tax=Hydra vulgaris TaxID=6087 RepID=UPI001F5F39E6|nr:probable serine incorporator [Hydra vulgaris]XP_047140377.1 probable serine incorporator [Hydra vulgaris]
MGCVLGVCAAQIACCCCSTACSLCCSCCPSSVTSVMTRLMYLFLIVLGVLTSSVFLIPQVQKSLSKSVNIPFYDNSVCGMIKLGKECEKAVGYQSVYRVWFAFVMFFLLMAFLTLGIRSSKDCRAYLHNGFWFFKILIIIGVMIAAFFLPATPFTKIWLYIGTVGGVVFIMVQVLFLIEFAHRLTEALLNKADDNKCCGFVMAILCLIMYGLAIAGVVGMYINFTVSNACNLNKGLISISLFLCIIVSIVSVLPPIQAANQKSGILQASVVSVYVTYLNFSALGAEPVGSKSWECPYNLSNINGAGVAMLVVGIVIALITVFYASFKKSHDDVGVIEDEEAHKQKVADDETESVQYSYWLFHLTCMLASFYCMMVLTNWFKPETVNKGFEFAASWPSMWVQIVASWVCILLYMWTMVAPVLFPDRFSSGF